MQWFQTCWNVETQSWTVVTGLAAFPAYNSSTIPSASRYVFLYICWNFNMLCRLWHVQMWTVRKENSYCPHLVSHAMFLCVWHHSWQVVHQNFRWLPESLFPIEGARVWIFQSGNSFLWLFGQHSNQQTVSFHTKQQQMSPWEEWRGKAGESKHCLLFSHIHTAAGPLTALKWPWLRDCWFWDKWSEGEDSVSDMANASSLATFQSKNQLQESREILVCWSVVLIVSFVIYRSSKVYREKDFDTSPDHLHWVNVRLFTVVLHWVNAHVFTLGLPWFLSPSFLWGSFYLQCWVSTVTFSWSTVNSGRQMCFPLCHN